MGLAQLALEDNSNELSVIPERLTLLELEGASVSIDAAGCHKEVAEQIIDQGADYVLSLKANHGLLFDEANWLFTDHNEAIALDKAETFDVAHGRQETRTCWLQDLSYLEQAECGLADWQEKAVLVVDAQVVRQTKQTHKRRFFLTSHDFSASQALTRVRKHWSIENQQH